jgi:hypothetical protein
MMPDKQNVKYSMGFLKNRLQRQIFGSKRQNVMGDETKWHINDLHGLYAAKYYIYWKQNQDE